MNELKLRAYGKVAQTLAERAFSESTPFSPAFPEVPGPIYRHYGNSTFEDLATVLWRLGILRSLEPELKLARYFAFDCELNEAENVAQRNWQNGPSLFELLEVFIDLFDEYGKEYHDFTSAIYVPFGRNGRLTVVLDALASIGYVEKTSEGYVWTDAEPVMRLLYGFDGLSDPAAFERSPDERSDIRGQVEIPLGSTAQKRVCHPMISGSVQRHPGPRV